MKSPEISGKLLARNMLLNLIGQGLPLLVGVVSVPLIIHGLGTDRFGLLSLAWVVLGYFAIFDLGLGRATTKFVAEALGKGDEKEIPRIAWTAVTVQVIFGILGGALLVCITPFLVEHVLKIPATLVKEAKVTFLLLAPSIPVVLVSGSFQGILEAFQRFDLINVVKIPSSVFTFLLPLLGLHFGFKLPGIVLLILLSRIVALVLFVVFDFNLVSGLFQYSCCFSIFPRLFSFGAWVTVANIIIPFFVYLDRFLVGSLNSISAVAYYTAPYELVTKLLIIPNSISIVLFPVFSRFSSNNQEFSSNDDLVARSIKYVIIAMMPFIIIFLINGKYILKLWLGETFAIESITVFRLLSIAVMFNAIGCIPYAMIQGIGRPDVIAKYHLIELPIYFLVAFSLVSSYNINGAALAWCLRMIWTIPIFSVLCIKIAKISLSVFIKKGVIRSLIGSICVIILCFLLIKQGCDILTTVIVTIVLLLGYILFIWIIALDNIDKCFIKSVIIKNKIINLIVRS